jgi:hypothetical protein
MKHIARSLVVVSVVALGLPAILSAGAAAAPTLSQGINGGGRVRLDPGHIPSYTGTYTSNAQLGSGRLSFDVGAGPNQSEFTRADGMTMKGTTQSEPCAPTDPNTRCFALNLTGSADIAQAHLDIAVVVSASPTGFLMRGFLTLAHRIGYEMVDTNGTTYAFGGMDHLGDAHTSGVTDLERTPSGFGYWMVNASGTVFAFGDARNFGNLLPGFIDAGETITSMSATPTGNGYWLFSSKGRAFTFGDAKSLGDMHGTKLNGRVVGSIATPTGKGYYMVAADGGVFAFGDAKFRGSMGNTRLNQPVDGLVPTPDNTGYWLVASDGGVFSFNAPFKGSLGAIPLNRPIVTMVPFGTAYLMVASDGGVFNFSHNPFFGSKGGTPLPAPITNAAEIG